jgi:hypothetical protein
MRLQPFADFALRNAKRRLLQRLQRQQTPLRFLEITTALIGLRLQFALALTQRLNSFAAARQALAGRLLRFLGACFTFDKLSKLRLHIVRRKRLDFGDGALALRAQAAQLIFQLFYSCALDLRLLAGGARIAVEIIP